MVLPTTEHAAVLGSVKLEGAVLLVAGFSVRRENPTFTLDKNSRRAGLQSQMGQTDNDFPQRPLPPEPIVIVGGFPPQNGPKMVQTKTKQTSNTNPKLNHETTTFRAYIENQGPQDLPSMKERKQFYKMH